MRPINLAIALGLFILGAAPASALELGTYNVENLFDSDHDENKTDWEYLPIGYPGKHEACLNEPKEYVRKCQSVDWSAEKVEIKLNQLAKVFLERGSLPDLLALQEVENPIVVQRLIEKLKKFGNLKFVMTNSPDKRGIDNVLIYKDSSDLKLVRQGEVVIGGDLFSKKPTRNVLEAEFQIAGREKLVVYVNHWPSQGTKNSEVRLEAGRQLRAHINRQYPAKDTSIVLVGDFNVIDSEKPNPIGSVLLSEFEGGPAFIDTDASFWALQTKLGKEIEERALRSKGSYFFATEMVWNLFDHVFASPALSDGKGLELNVASYEIYSPESLKKDLKKGNSIEKGVPKKYNVNAKKADAAGFSDHFPVFVKLEIK